MVEIKSLFCNREKVEIVEMKIDIKMKKYFINAFRISTRLMLRKCKNLFQKRYEYSIIY